MIKNINGGIIMLRKEQTLNKTMNLIDSIKFYFKALGEELDELFLIIWDNVKSVKLIIILSSILLFAIGCFIWKPLFGISMAVLMMLMISLCIMIIPIACSYTFEACIDEETFIRHWYLALFAFIWCVLIGWIYFPCDLGAKLCKKL